MPPNFDKNSYWFQEVGRPGARRLCQASCRGMRIGKQVGAASMQQPRADGKLFIGHFRGPMRPCDATFPLRSLRANCRAGLGTGHTGGLSHLELSDRDRVK